MTKHKAIALSFVCSGRALVAVSVFLLVTAIRATDFAYPNTTLTRLAFGSCHKSKYANTSHNIWKTIQEKTNPQVWLWTGDAVYPPSRSIASLELLRQSYREMKENETIGYSNLQSMIFGTWDDHDYGGNDAGNEMPDRAERANLFFDFLSLDKPDPRRQGVYHSVTFGLPPQQVKIILLDTRWHREKHCIPSVATKIPLGAGFACVTRWLTAGLLNHWCDPSTSLLGEEQWMWFEDELFQMDEQPAVALVVSSIQVLTTNPTMEGWGHFPAERDRLIRLLARKGGSQVFILSGDVHHGEILDPMPQLEHRFLEVTSSGLTHDCSKHIYGKLCKPLLNTFSEHRFESPKNYFIGKNYGTVSLDWENHNVEIQVHDSEGRAVLTTGKRSWKDLPTTSSWTEEQFNSVPACMNGHLLPLVKGLALAAAIAIFMSYGMMRWHKR